MVSFVGFISGHPEKPADTDRDHARMINAAMPFAPQAGPNALPFVMNGDATSRERAVDCLASAMWYEAGNDARGQRSVGQVVLNRVRHRAFPASVCGVIFQGSARSTGCQFTFTCDGAMRRTPSDREFVAARKEAAAMLYGSVDSSVGLATHYHTDWVAPVWSAQMDKIAQVDTHLFFRWRGGAGNPGAMNQTYSAQEPIIPALARISSNHRTLPGETVAGAELAEAGVEQFTGSVALAAMASARAPREQRVEGVFQIDVTPGSNGGSQAMAALEICADRSFCKVIGRLAPSSVKVAFLYVRDRKTGVDQAFWDCDTYRRANSAQCLTGQNRPWLGFDGNFQTGSARTQSAGRANS